MTTPGQTLPHRAVSTIRGGGGGSSINTSGATPSDNPRTPLGRPLSAPVPPASSSASFGSPSSLRAEDEVLVVELGARRLRVGFAGDAAPKAVVAPAGPEQARRVGDFRRWEVGYADDWRKKAWDGEHELWRADVRGLDLGLVGDRLERGLREAFSRCVVVVLCPTLAGVCRGCEWCVLIWFLDIY